MKFISETTLAPLPGRGEILSGSEILLRSLLAEGVECVFGYPGGAVLYIYDAMHDNPDFHHLLTRHEQGAIHAADGYARSTGKTGVVMATSGPGAANLVTGIATAYMDSVPLVVITGNVSSDLIGTDSFQEVDIIGITQPIIKHSYLVRHASELARTIKEAFHIASTGRKGPVLIDIPKDVSAAVTEFILPDQAFVPGYTAELEARAKVDQDAIERLVSALKDSKKPLLLAGGGVIQADGSEELLDFIERTGTPVTTTLLGLGVVPADHELWLGMPGMHGTYAANQALLQCDLLIAVGVRFDDRVTMKLDSFAPNAKVAHIDIDAAEIGKLVRPSIPITGDARVALGQLNRSISSGHMEKKEWTAALRKLKTDYRLRFKSSDKELKPQYVIEMISRTTKGEAIITTDVGQHQMWTAQYYQFRKPRSLITSGGLGTMGFGFPSAIGAQIGNPDTTVISVNGDGGIQMCSQELAICSIHHIPVKIVILNNQTLGMIRQWQELIYEGRYSHIDLSGSPDFVKLAEAYGVKGLRAETPAEAERVWQEALTTKGPVLIDFVISRDELVYPMIPQGKGLQDIILGPDIGGEADETKKTAVGFGE
ncbi:acetolactate synthase, large subunit [Paenibacillus sp. UNCCL117]|uniref:biosynthetic-type acetolactate synthase large subunit n=1 Tax=unclassified Paenibacillus TaxID=185978 RepID=UPI00088623A6|nr:MULTISPECIES: biosynthetic-type acetolactate synthase large subunit [unclassified Paenibacillus]SDC11846.1 acetolactate synthase, large subunit [Paenibacillus sp. cl123]SFW16697.1 acetolactate synthase, large subunit [Paenibacillus sp. UNCCL117]